MRRRAWSWGEGAEAVVDTKGAVDSKGKVDPGLQARLGDLLKAKKVRLGIEGLTTKLSYGRVGKIREATHVEVRVLFDDAFVEVRVRHDLLEGIRIVTPTKH